jgi:hypothetical protein
MDIAPTTPVMFQTPSTSYKRAESLRKKIEKRFGVSAEVGPGLAGEEIVVGFTIPAKLIGDAFCFGLGHSKMYRF